MFYCDECRDRMGWPDGLLKSFGKCECCDVVDLCSDVPSRLLPIPSDPQPAYYEEQDQEDK